MTACQRFLLLSILICCVNNEAARGKSGRIRGETKIVVTASTTGNSKSTEVVTSCFPRLRSLNSLFPTVSDSDRLLLLFHYLSGRVARDDLYRAGIAGRDHFFQHARAEYFSPVRVKETVVQETAKRRLGKWNDASILSGDSVKVTTLRLGMKRFVDGKLRGEIFQIRNVKIRKCIERENVSNIQSVIFNERQIFILIEIFNI